MSNYDIISLSHIICISDLIKGIMDYFTLPHAKKIAICCLHVTINITLKPNFGCGWLMFIIVRSPHEMQHTQ